MKNTCIKYLLLALLLLNGLWISAQEAADKIVPQKEIRMMVDSIATSVKKYYISEQMGIDIANYIRARQKKGSYNKLSYKEFGKQLTKDFIEVSGDVHMAAFYDEHEEGPQETLLSAKLDKRGAISNYGYVENKILEGNIGYLKIDHFTTWKFFDEAKKAVTNSMEFLQNVDALIVDVRDNGGGFEEIVAYLVSYFFKAQPFHLQEYYCRHEDRKREIRTEEVPGKKLADIPAYILVNKGTGSAAESFAYLLKHLDRATVIGETTVGAGNGSNYYRISDNFLVQIATWETINAITKTSWEKTGVIPNIETTSKEAYDKALELAKSAGKKHREKLIKSYEKLLSEMDSMISGYDGHSSEKELLNKLMECKSTGLINESVVNAMGYNYLLTLKKPETAEAIFKTNTILYPQSANVYDSYAEALSFNGKLKPAIENYTKAVALAEKNKDNNLRLFRENLKKAKEAIEK